MDPSLPPPLPTTFPLPQFHAHLQPFIHPRSEALRIRQAVTAYFADLVEAIESGGGGDVGVDLYADGEDGEDGNGKFENEVDGKMLGRGTPLGGGVEKGGEGVKVVGKKTVGGGGIPRKTGVPGSTVGGGLKPGGGGHMGGLRLRREYLLALRENVLARREYEVVMASIPSEYDGIGESGDSDEEYEDDDEEEIDSGGEGEGVDGNTYGLRKGQGGRPSAREFLDIYISTHLLARQLHKLRLLEKYVRQFPTFIPTGGGKSSSQQFTAQFPPPPQPQHHGLLDGGGSVPATGGGIVEDAQAKIILPLEKAIYNVYSEIQSEEQRLEGIRRRYTEIPMQEPVGVVGGDKKAALERTRKELFDWMEERLVWSAPPPPPDKENGGNEREGEKEGKESESGNIYEKVLREIGASYAAYLESRMRLVALVQQSLDTTKMSSSSSSSNIPPLQPPDQSTQTPTNTFTPTPFLPLLPLLTEHLPHLTHTQKSLHMTKSHLSTILSHTHTRLSETLSTLAGQSHLLQSLLSDGGKVDVSQGMGTVDIVKLWEEVGRVRRKALREEVDEKVGAARAGLERVEEGMRELEGEVLGRKSVEEEEGEMGTGEAQEETARGKRGGIPVLRGATGKGGAGRKGGVGGARGTAGRKEEQERKGLWVGLGGAVGVIGDGI